MVLAGDEQGYAPASLLEPIDGSSSADEDTFNDQGLSICSFVGLSVRVSVCMYMCLSICLSVHVSFCMSVCLSV